MIESLKKITVANSEVSGTVGSVEGLVVLLEEIEVQMDFLVTDNPPFDVIIGLALREFISGVCRFEKANEYDEARKRRGETGSRI